MRGSPVAPEGSSINKPTWLTSLGQSSTSAFFVCPLAAKSTNRTVIGGADHEPVKQMPKLKHEDALQIQPEWCRIVISSIRDAVITTDTEGRVTFLNPVAESLTGWTQDEALGVSLETVFQIVNQDTRQAVENPAVRALRDGVIVVLANHTLLIAKDGTECPIEDSATPIRNDRSEVSGVVLVFRNVTERRRKELHLQRALSLANSIIATMREPFVVFDKDLRIKTANRSFYHKFQVSREETEGRCIDELGNGQWNIPRLRMLLEQVRLENSSFQNFEIEHDFPSIGKKIMLLNATRFESVNSESGLILLAIEDVTQRRRTEEKLRRSEQRYRRVVDLMPAGVYTVDAAGIITFFNRQAAALWGRSPQLGDSDERFCGSTRMFHTDGTPLPLDQTPVATILQNGTCVRDMEAVIEQTDGSRVHVRVNVDPIRDSVGKIIGAINVFHDVTERKRMELALQTSEVRYRRLFETAKDGILILDAKSLQIIDANPFMTELLGYTHDEFRGKELWEIGLFGDKQASQAAYHELQEKGYIRYDHLPLETKHGQKAEVEFVSNIYQVDGRTVAQCNIRDISERSRLERRLKEQTEALADLHRRKDEFLAMLSHELRNPLAPISNAVLLLRLHTNENPLQQKALTIIERQLTQLTRLVDDLMEVSRITTGRIQLQRKRVALSGILENGVETARTLIGKRRHELTVSLPPQPIWVYVDASRLEQVVVNLLTNAAKYTDEGGHIWLTVDEDGEDCILKVRDTGVGIAAELVPRIFDLFTQAERSLDRSQGGLGIGLALVQRLVEMHGGSVSARSVLGEGSEFVVRLPRVLPVESSLSATERAELTGPSLRVLVVDDSLDTAETVAMLLKTRGHDVRIVHDGPSTLQAALDYRPDVVLLDIGLPGLDGFEVAKRLKQHPMLSGIVLVAMTGYGQESDHQRSQEAGFDHHLVKPVDFGKVQQILATVSEQAP